ncbi:hypothetical protein [Mycobacterium lepromatosis]|uniref:hypothetical protein n=1 Tax=Mycobacterium lepromatosis TaxID=480418 RepID=UPI001F1F0B7F|nr:hypothetical protein [Mycobacterium lepromatosis]
MSTSIAAKSSWLTAAIAVNSLGKVVVHYRLTVHRQNRANAAIGHHRAKRRDVRCPIQLSSLAEQFGAVAGEDHQPHALRCSGSFNQHVSLTREIRVRQSLCSMS